MIDSLYNYYLKQNKSEIKGFFRKRLFWYIYKFLKFALLSYYKRFNNKSISNLNKSSDLIVSLTSLPSRIDLVHLTIKSIFNQSNLPHKIILWLGEEKFPNRLADLPDDLLELKESGLEIQFCEDFRATYEVFLCFFQL